MTPAPQEFEWGFKFPFTHFDMMQKAAEDREWKLRQQTKER
jgi:hypothetical protein